ncbi:hypothetical protein [Roseibium sediminicola]|uniref:IS66 family transposase n=1 Tax=Roseibium sediminicola TaxID=2933272 RepID=UPI003CE4DFE5
MELPRQGVRKTPLTIEAAEAELPFDVPSGRVEAPKTKPVRQPLPDHLPRHEIVHDLGERSCPCCGGRDFFKSGRGITEVLDYAPRPSVLCAMSSRALCARVATRRSPRPCRRCRSSAASPAWA